MSDTILELDTVDVVDTTKLEIEGDSGLVTPYIVENESVIEGRKSEYTIVGDGLYASVSAEEAPQWLLSIIDSVLGSALDGSLSDLTAARDNILAAINEVDIAKNQYQELINIDTTIEGIIASRLATLNATLDGNSANIVELEATKVTHDEALALSVSNLNAELLDGSIRSEITRVDTSVALLGSSTASSIEILEADYEGISGAVSTLENTVMANADSAMANFAYNATLTLDGVDYASGFGLATNLNSGTIPVGSSEFWIKADSFRVKDTLGNDYLYWNDATNTLEITGNIVGSTITGSTFRTGISGKRILMSSVDNNINVFNSDGQKIFFAGDGSPVYSPYSLANVYSTLFASAGNNQYALVLDGMLEMAATSSANLQTTDLIGTRCDATCSGTRPHTIGGRFVGGVSSLPLGNSTRTTGVYGRAYTNANSTEGIGVSGLVLTTSGTTIGVKGYGNTYDFYANGPGANYGPFTGAHDALVDELKEYVIGDIVCDDQLIAIRGISNTIFSVTVSNSSYTPAIGVVVSKKSDMVPAAISKRGEDDVETATLPEGYKTIQFNAVGEGMLNVCGEGGNLSNGDLIVTSSMPGKGMRQNKEDGTPDDIVRNITVAKIRGNWDFSSIDEVKMIPCIYLCG